jgi:primary-amine oxidase
MIPRWFLAAGWLGGLALLLFPGHGLGQDQKIVTTVSPATLEAIFGDLSIRYDKKPQQGPGGQVVQGNYLYFFKQNGRTLILFTYGGKELMLQHRLAKLPLEKVNAWNIAAHFSRAYTRPDRPGQPGLSVIEWNLDCRGGVTSNSIKQFIHRFGEELTLFEKFVGPGAIAEVPNGDPIKVNPKTDPDPVQPIVGGPFRLPVTFRDESQRELEVTFPLGERNWQTAWKIEWQIDRRPVPQQLRSTFTRIKENVYFSIKQAWFRSAPTEPWIQVLSDARASELFVPYNDGVIRWYDVMDHGVMWKIVDEKAEAGPRGQVLGKDRFVVGELRDRGIMYKNFGDGRARRGETFVLWGNLNAGNYNYIIEYGFQDDGVVTCRMGATGHNLHLPGNKHDYPRMGHVHNANWRLGIRLGPEGQQSNTAYLVRHVEKEQGKGTADQVPSLFNDGLEGAAKWVPEEFTRIRVENPEVTVGRNRQPIAYELVPLRQGTARHFGNRSGGQRTEAFSMYDFWVTREDSKHFYYTELPAYFTRLKNAGKEPGKIENTNVVLWYTSSILHDPRAEDGISPDHRQPPQGPALVAWSGFELRPRNVFTGTPLFTPGPRKMKQP